MLRRSLEKLEEFREVGSLKKLPTAAEKYQKVLILRIRDENPAMTT